MKKISVFILIIFTAILVSGCATSGRRHSKGEEEMPRTLEVASSLKFQDVPAPNGFKIIPKDSFVFDNDITRLGIIKYSGREDASTVVKFYRDQMPLYNWRFVNLIEFNTRIINFDRDDQTCTIIIEPGAINQLVIVSVAPKAGRASTYKIEEEDNK